MAPIESPTDNQGGLDIHGVPNHCCVLLILIRRRHLCFAYSTYKFFNVPFTNTFSKIYE